MIPIIFAYIHVLQKNMNILEIALEIAYYCY